MAEMEYESVSPARMMVRENRRVDRRLVAYRVLNTQAESHALALYRHFDAQLLEYVVPTAVIEIADTPLALNGKLACRALPAFDNPSTPKSGYRAPESEPDQTFALVGQELLNADRVGRKTILRAARPFVACLQIEPAAEAGGIER